MLDKERKKNTISIHSAVKNQLQNIKNDISRHSGKSKTARLYFLSNPPCVFEGDDELQYVLFDIKDRISSFFGVPLTSVCFAGSFQVGYSVIKDRPYDPNVSDLDLAILDSSLFSKWVAISCQATNSYRDLTKFPDNEKYRSFLKYLSFGFFRPDLMPNCLEKRDWFNFFKSVSGQYKRRFKKVNCGVYANQHCFELKQARSIELISQKGV